MKDIQELENGVKTQGQTNKKRIWEFFIDNFKFTLILLFAIVAFGALSIFQIPKESQPDIEIPVVIVSTFFSGANAEDVEELVTNVIEDKLSSLEDVDEITSTSSKGISTVAVQFDVDSDTDEKLNDVKDRIDLAKRSLPDDAEEPTVQKVRLSDRPVITVTLSGPFQVSQLKDFAETIKEETETVSGVSDVKIIGGLDREVHVIVDKARLDQYSLGINAVTRAIGSANSDIPIGVIESADRLYTLNFTGKLEYPSQVEDIPITQINGVPVLVRDVATVFDGFNIPSSKSRLSVGAEPSLTSVSLKYFKTSGGNVVEVVDTILERIEKTKENLPEDIIISKTEDNAEQVRVDLRNLVINGTQTVLIVMILLLLFVGFREALLAGMVIPLTFLITFTILNSLGFSLNFLTLFSLLLSLGVLVDGSIVITQGMNAYMKKGYSALNSARQTIRDFELPLISGTLTTVFAFVPMLMASGIIGKYIRTIPVTVTIVLMSSLFVALGLITSIGSVLLVRKKDKTGHITSKEQDHITEDQDEVESEKKENFFVRVILHGLKRKYIEVFDSLVASKPKRQSFTFLLIGLFVASMALPVSGTLKVEMFPQGNQDTFYINYELPPGTPLERTNFEIQKIEQLLEGDSRIETFVVNVGSLSSAGSTSNLESNKGSIIINLKDDREQSSIEVVEDFERKLEEITYGNVSVVQLSNGPDQSAPVEVRITGTEIYELEQLAFDVQELVESIEGTRGVDVSFDDPNPEFVMTFDRIKAQVYGLTTNQLALSLRNAINGLEATKIKKDGDEINVIVKYSLDPLTQEDNITNRVDINTVENITIATQLGNIPLANFVKTSVGASQQSINHKDSKRLVRVLGYTEDGVTPQAIFEEIENRLHEISIPAGYAVSLGGENEDIAESFADMFRAMIFGVLLIAALLVLQFKSYRQPLFILATIPLALIAVFPGLMLVGLPLSFPGIIGVVALIGIVVNNAIILIDRININRKNGALIKDAIREASISRFDPILLTTITTVFGILPLAIRDETWGPLGWSIVFGLSFSTILTLLVVPLLYNRYAKVNRYDDEIKAVPIIENNN